jgi:hypothetical protein
VRLGRIAHFLGRHDPGAKRAGSIKILSWNELAGMALPLTDRSVIVTGVARHHLLPVALRDVPATPSDDHRQFAFVIERVRRRRPYHLLAMSDL